MKPIGIEPVMNQLWKTSNSVQKATTKTYNMENSIKKIEENPNKQIGLFSRVIDFFVKQKKKNLNIDANISITEPPKRVIARKLPLPAELVNFKGQPAAYKSIMRYIAKINNHAKYNTTEWYFSKENILQADEQMRRNPQILKAAFYMKKPDGSRYFSIKDITKFFIFTNTLINDYYGTKNVQHIEKRAKRFLQILEERRKDPRDNDSMIHIINKIILFEEYKPKKSPRTRYR